MDLDYKDFGENLQQDLDKMTFDEVVKKYKTTKKQMKQWIKEYNLQIKYEYRTPVTQQLIPVSSYLNKLFKNKHQKEKCNSMYSKEEIQHQIDWIKNLYKAEEYTLGALSAQLQTTQEQIKQHMERFLFSQLQVQLLEKYGETGYLTYLAEEQCGTRPTVEDFNETYITEDMLYGYIATKYGLSKMLYIKQILEDKND